MQTFELKFSGVTILRGVEFHVFLLILSWALQQCSATALPVMTGIRTEEHCLISEVGIGSESDCLLGKLCKILEISDSEEGLKVEKAGGVLGGD